MRDVFNKAKAKWPTPRTPRCTEQAADVARQNHIDGCVFNKAKANPEDAALQQAADVEGPEPVQRA